MADQVIAGRYRLGERLGGGMSEVWSAIDLELDREVALKLLAPHADPVRFEREARAAAALAHPNICTVYSYGETDGRPFIVLEYLPGGSLESRLAGDRPLPDEESGRIAVEIAAGLAHAHGRGLVHRDLKPSNVLFDGAGRAKIADFGIARLGEEAGLTAAGTVLGTAAYISPEQAAGERATPASDVYSFGVILFKMLTGRLPFETEDALEAATLHRDRQPPPVTSIRPDAPPRLESVAAAALSKSPHDRPRDGRALLAELEDAVRASPGETAATRMPPAPKRRRLALLLAAAALLAAAGVAVAVGVTFRGSSGPPSIPTSSEPPALLASAPEQRAGARRPPRRPPSMARRRRRPTRPRPRRRRPCRQRPLRRRPGRRPCLRRPRPSSHRRLLPPTTEPTAPPPATTETTAVRHDDRHHRGDHRDDGGGATRIGSRA